MKKTLTLILIITWMITVFIFSNQPSKQSSDLSEGFTTAILKILNLYPESQEKLDKIETLIRKLAHYTIYTIGGILIYTHVNLYNKKTKNKIVLSQIIRLNICNNRRNTSNLCNGKKRRNKGCTNRFIRGNYRNINCNTSIKNSKEG